MSTALPLTNGGGPGREIRVMICDDSVVVRSALARMLESDPAIRVVARVANGALAVQAVQAQPIDVVILDIEMAVMDGLAALPLLLRCRPDLRVLVSSSLGTRGAATTLQALALGAADYLPKPSAPETADSFRSELLAKVRTLGGGHSAAKRSGPAPASLTLRQAGAATPRLIAIGSSTGGPQALLKLVHGLGAGLPVPVVLTQHMPASFIPILADHIGRAGALPCAEAEDGETLRAGRIYVAPGDRHLTLRAAGTTLRAVLSSDPPENFCRPAADPMLRSAAEACGGRVVVAMLTGMGQDGLAGTRRIVEAGGTAIAQDEASSVVWGMPGAVARAGLCHAVLPLPRMAAKLLDLVKGSRA